MRLFNTIAIFDTYVVAGTSETARDALTRGIACGDITPSEITATESRMERSVRQGCRDERPYVADDISEEDFKRLQGKTTIAIFQHIYLKRS